jgi:heme oxygenase
MSPSTLVLPESVRPLSAAMREDSRTEHDAAEHSPFMSELLGGNVNAQGYVDYLRRLRMIYAALERAVREQRADPLIAAVYDPALERLSAIDADLGHWLGEAAPEVDSPAARTYRDRIAAASGVGLLAHHYTRYLGDLSGGRVIGRMLDRAFALGGAGLSFYDFAMPAKPYKDAYRARLDGFVLSRDETDQVVDEVRLAFRLNMELFDELAANLAAYRR